VKLLPSGLYRRFRNLTESAAKKQVVDYTTGYELHIPWSN